MNEKPITCYLSRDIPPWWVSVRRAGWQTTGSELERAEIPAHLARAHFEADEALRKASEAIAPYLAGKVVKFASCGSRRCGGYIANYYDAYRCTDCNLWFHRDCLKDHCNDELTRLRAELAAASPAPGATT